MNAKNYAVAILVETPGGIPLVCDPQKPSPRYWKFPGGRSEPGEEPAQTAARELREETGITVKPEQLSLAHQETKGEPGREHVVYLFRAVLETPVKLLKRGGGGEQVAFFTLATIKTLKDFFPNHRAMAEKIYFFS